MALFSASEGGRVQLTIDPVMTCALCLEEKSLRDMYELQECKCKYCTNCMKAYLCVTIHEGYVMSITCPDAACHKGGKIRISEASSNFV
jgi:E3 ubiquitin-protein ligase RNF144